MKIYILLSTSVCAMTAFLFGCHSPIPKAPEAPVKQAEFSPCPKIRISCVGNREAAAPFADAVGRFFVKKGGSVVNGNPHYVVMIFAESRSRVDQPAENEYNVIVSKTSRSNAYGGEEYVTSRKFTTSTSSLYVSIAVYKVGTLDPILYFDMPFYSGGNAAPLTPAAAAQRFVSQLSKAIVFRKLER